jgi:hypothetical protein
MIGVEHFKGAFLLIDKLFTDERGLSGRSPKRQEGHTLQVTSSSSLFNL